jgi:hypothetical protein
VAAKPELAIPLAAIGVGLAVAMPRLLQDRSLSIGDWITVVIGLGVALGVGAMLVSAYFKR